MEPADWFRLHPLGDPQLSPDGRSVAYVRETVAADTNRVTGEIWLVATDGGSAPRRMTAPGHRDRAPRWSPDGGRIAFLSDRTGKPRLHVLPAAGGEAECWAPDLEPAGPASWLPDGAALVVASAVDTPPPGGAEYAGAPAHDAAQTKLDDYRPPLVVTTLHHKLDGAGFHGTHFRQLFAVGAEGAPRQLTSGRYHHEAAAISPDGGHVLCLARRERPGDDGGWIRHPYLVPLAGGEPVRVLAEDFPCAGAALSPDGRQLALVGSGRAFDWVSSNYDLFLLDVSAGAYPYRWSDARNLTGALDRPVGGGSGSDTRHMSPPGHPRWSPDGRTVYVTIGSEGEGTLYAVSAGGEPRRASPGARRDVAQASPVAATGAIAYLAGDPTHPDEVHVLTPDGGERRLTEHNAAVAAELGLAPPERITFAGADGWPIEGWLFVPAGAGPHPLILDVHGGPSGMYGYGFAFAPQMLRSQGFAVLRINPRASLGYGNRFSLAVVGDWGGKDYQDLMAGVDHAIAAGIADPRRLGVMGWSYGGYMTTWIVTQTERFRAAVAGACISDHYSGVGTMDVGMDFTVFSQGATPWEDRERLFERSPMAYVDRVRTPVLLLHGEADLRCPVTQSEEFFTALQMLGRQAAFVRYPGEPHGIAQPRNKLDRLERQLAWFRHHLGDRG